MGNEVISLGNEDKARLSVLALRLGQLQAQVQREMEERDVILSRYVKEGQQVTNIDLQKGEVTVTSEEEKKDG